MSGEDREIFSTGAYFQNVVAVVVAREDLFPKFEVSLSTTNSVPFLELPYAYNKKDVRTNLLSIYKSTNFAIHNSLHIIRFINTGAEIKKLQKK